MNGGSICRITTAIAAALTVFGCRTSMGPAPAVTYEVGQAPEFFMLYYPYGPALDHSLARPMPSYSGWTDARMDRDLSRFSAVGIDVILLAINLSDFEKKYQRERFIRFFEISSKYETTARTALWLYHDDTTELSTTPNNIVQQLLEWHLAARLAQFSATYRMQGRPLIILAPELANLTANHPAFHLIRTKGLGASWTWEPPTAAQAYDVNSEGSQAVIYPGWRGTGNYWTLSRDSGRTFRRALWDVFVKRPQYICISSWNDFANGAFVEPNTLDNEAALQVLMQEIQRVAQAVQPPALSVE